MKAFMIRRPGIRSYCSYDFGQMVPRKMLYWVPYEYASIWTCHVRANDVLEQLRAWNPQTKMELVTFDLSETGCEAEDDFATNFEKSYRRMMGLKP